MIYTELTRLVTGEIIEGLSGATYLIEKKYIVKVQNDFSLIMSERTKLNLLFLGPAAFCNHDCEANAEIICRSKIRTDVRAIRNI